MKATLRRISLLAALVALTACGSSPSTQATEEEGLQLDESTSSRASGQFTSNGTSVHFDFVKGEGAGELAFQVSDGSGQLLYTAERRGDRFTAGYLADELVVSGPWAMLSPTASTTGADTDAWVEQVDVVGDLAVLDEVRATPEFSILDELSTALDDQGQFSELLGAGQLTSPGLAEAIEKSAQVAAAASCGLFKRIRCAPVDLVCATACAPFAGGDKTTCLRDCTCAHLQCDCLSCIAH